MSHDASSDRAALSSRRSGHPCSPVIGSAPPLALTSLRSSIPVVVTSGPLPAGESPRKRQASLGAINERGHRGCYCPHVVLEGLTLRSGPSASNKRFIRRRRSCDCSKVSFGASRVILVCRSSISPRRSCRTVAEASICSDDAPSHTRCWCRVLASFAL